MKIIFYTREPINNVLYDPRLAYSMHLGYVDEQGKAHALNHNSGVLFVKATENEDGSLNPKSLEAPYVFRRRNGEFGVLARRIEGDGGEDTQSGRDLVYFTSKNLVRYEEIGLVPEDGSRLLGDLTKARVRAYASWEKQRAQAADGIDLSQIEGCVFSCALDVKKGEWEYLQKKLTTPKMCGVEVPASIKVTYPDDLKRLTVPALFSDGTKVMKHIQLQQETIDKIDFGKPGKYHVPAKVVQPHFDNPIAIDRADPDVFFWEGKYYYIATNDADGNHSLFIREADCLEDIAGAQEHLLLDSTMYDNIKGLLWAPEFHEINGRLYIFHAATREEFFAEESRIMTLREGGNPICKEDWSRPERIVKMDGSELCEEGRVISLDMTCFAWEGDYYVIWSQREFLPKDLGAWLYIAKLNPEKPWMLATDPIVLSKPDYGWGNNHTFVEEGPFALMRENTLYITFSAAAVDSSYVVSFLEISRGKELLDPSQWRKNNYPILTSRNVPGEYGTGHNAYVIDELGTVWNTYHARFGAEAPRSSSIRRVHFDIDGEPMLDVTEELDLDPSLVNIEVVLQVRPEKPQPLKGKEYSFDAFENGKVLENKKKQHLPAMGWNSWNAFGSGNTEMLTKRMAELFIRLGLDRCGYEYLVLDDGCYLPERREELLANKPSKFPNGFKALADYIHGKGLKFGMYNDIGTNLCAGAEVGTCGYEKLDAQTYVNWGVDFLKVDNCYYLWDNATFSNPTNAKFTYAPWVQRIALVSAKGSSDYKLELTASEGSLYGNGAKLVDGHVENIGTFDGTGPDQTPVGAQSVELRFVVDVPENGDYKLRVFYRPGREPGRGNWLQLATGEGATSQLWYDDFIESASSDGDDFAWSKEITLSLSKGENLLRLMNHRRQENTLQSYASLLEGLNQADPNHDILLSICEWGKTQPQNWGYKVGDSWRILNDITFQVGADGYPGKGAWESDYTTSVLSQYNKAVIMDEFAGLDKGWNDPDMMMIGMNGMTMTMNRSHMAMWCMLNAPLMLGMDLRRVKKGDALWKIITCKGLIALNQDALGIQSKRAKIYMENGDVITMDSEKMERKPSEGSLSEGNLSERNLPADQVYLRGGNRVDILVKPLMDGSVAIGWFNLAQKSVTGSHEITVEEICQAIGKKMVNAEEFAAAKKYEITNLLPDLEKQPAAKSNKSSAKNLSKTTTKKVFKVGRMAGCDCAVMKVMPLQ